MTEPDTGPDAGEPPAELGPEGENACWDPDDLNDSNDFEFVPWGTGRS